MNTDNASFDFKSFAKQYKKWFWIGGVILVVIVAIGIANTIIGTFNEGKQKEQDLGALYGQSVNSLSICLDKGKTAAQVTEKEYATIKDILVGAASARYVDADGKSTNASGVLGGGQLISALQENYPQVDQRSWQNLQAIVVGCREEFQGKQDQIQVFAANYNKWRVTNDVFNFWIKAQFPSNQLKVVTSNGDTLYGQSAYDRITRVVAVDDALAAFESGQLENQDLFDK